MGWYVELHCDTSPCPYGHSEEGPQGNSVKNVAAAARRSGWTQIDGHWRCDGCARDLGHKPKGAWAR
jgi:rubredoxin